MASSLATVARAGSAPLCLLPWKLVVPMLERLLASDLGFAKVQRNVATDRRPES